MNAGKGLEMEEIKQPFPRHFFNGRFSAGSSNDSRAWTMNARNRIDPFVGIIDEVRFFSRALSRDQIRFLAAKGGTAWLPLPKMNETVAPGKTTLKWTAPPAATEFRIYLGRAHIAVAEATEENTGIFRGKLVDPTITISDLKEGTYFWHVDCSDGSTTIKGPVWSFETGESAEPEPITAK